MGVILESGLVAPSEETPKHGIWLSNLDLMLGWEYTPTFYVYRPNGDPGFFSVEKLKVALSKALVSYYPLAGRLEAGKDGLVEINCTGEGALFVVARSESGIDDDLGDFAPSEEMGQILLPSVSSTDPRTILLMLQVTFFKCGSVTLGVAVHHAAVDGLSALQFIKTWSDIARGIEFAVPLFLDRTLVRARWTPPVLSDYTDNKSNTKPSTSKAPVVSAILKLSKKQLISFKNSNGSGTSTRQLSTFRAVLAHVWRCACISRRLASDQETRLHVVADVRTRLRPPLPPGYFGNALCLTSAIATAGDVVSNPLEFSGEKIYDATARVDDEYVRSFIDCLELRKLEGALPGTDLFVISWLGLPIYDADFGWGKPEFMGRASIIQAGTVFIMHSPGDDGGISVAIAMETENMEGFKKAFSERMD